MPKTKTKVAIPDNDVTIVRDFMGPEWGLYALCYMQVCAHSETPPEVIERHANLENPTGLQSGSRWKIVTKGPDDIDLSPGPCRTEDGELTGRVHYMLGC